MAAYATRWQASQAYGPSAAVQRDIALRVHLLPVLGDRDLASITPTDAREWMAGMSGAVASIRHRTRIVSAMFSAAVDDGLIERNPFTARSVKPPRASRSQVEPWGIEQQRAVEQALPDRYRILVTLGLGLGLRSGEMFALSLDDIDLDSAEVTVRRQVRIDASRLRFALPKFEHTRTVPLPDYAAERIAEYLDAYPARPVTLPWASREAYEDGLPRTARLVVTSREAGAMNRNYVTSRLWRPALEAAGIPVERANGMHVLRHTYASTLLHAGVSIRTVSEYLGHQDPAFTLRTYAHLMPSSEVTARDALDAAMRPQRVPMQVVA